MGIILGACHESVDPKPYTYTQIFTGTTSKSWKASSVIIMKDGADDLNYTLYSCDKDDLYTFYANSENKFEYKNGNISCETEPTNTVLLRDSWSYISASATLLMYFPPLAGGSQLPFIVHQASASTLVLDIFADEKNTIRYRVTLQAVSGS